MHRIRSEILWLAALPILLMLWALAVHGQPAAASDESPESATALPTAGADVNGSLPYLSLGVASIRSDDTRFVDGTDAGHAALYGDDGSFDAGALGDGHRFHLAAGFRFSPELRAQLEFGIAPALDWRGNTNYRSAGERQPSEARLDTRQLLLAVFHDFPGWEIAAGRRTWPFLGAGLGLTDYRLRDYVQRFPEPVDPHGYLRRGPAGEIPFTAVPGGSGRTFTWMLSAGVAIPLDGNIHLDLSYRYTDAGEIRTDVGDIAVVRYREDGTRRDIPVTINRNSAHHRTHSLLVTLRFDL